MCIKSCFSKVKTGFGNMFRGFNDHPWKVAIGSVFASGCGAWVCGYFGVLLWVGLLALGWRYQGKDHRS